MAYDGGHFWIYRFAVKLYIDLFKMSNNNKICIWPIRAEFMCVTPLEFINLSEM